MKSLAYLWFWYLLGALLTLAWKWGSWVHNGAKKGQSAKFSTKEWFSIQLFEEKVSWVTTIGIVWVFGATYINKVNFWWTDYIKDIPAESCIAFLFGSAMELLAPAAAKWAMGKLPFGTGEGEK